MKAKSLIFGIAAANLLGQTNAFAQATWADQAAGGDWATANAWTIGGSPGSLTNPNGASALIFNTATQNRVYTNTLTNFTASSITVNSGSRDNTVTGNAINLAGGFSVATGSWQSFGMNIALLSGAGSFSQTTGQTTFSGQISGSEAISKTGGGTVVFSGSNNFSGNVTVSAGALSLTNNSSLGTTAGKTTANGGSLQLSNGITITGETLELAGNGGSPTTGALRNVSGNNTWTGSVTTVGNDSRILAVGGTLTISGIISSTNTGNNQVVFRGEGGTIELTNANSYGGVTRIFGTAGNAATVPMLRLSGGNNRLPIGTTIDIGGGGVSGSMEIAGISQEVAGLASNGNATTSRISGTGTATLVVNNSSDGTYTGTLNGSLAFTKTGAASYTLSGNNDYSRGTTINGGTLRVSHVAALGSGTVNLNAGSGAVLQLATDTSVNAYNLTMGSNRFNTIVSDKATPSTAGILHALGTLSIGSSTLTINKGSNATGDTAGVSFTSVDLSAGNNDRNVIFNGNGVISLGAVASLSNNIGFTGGPGNGATVATKVLQLDGTNVANTVVGVISDTNNTGSTVVSLIKANSSTWTLQSNNTYTGSTTIRGGTLKINSSTAIGSSPTITVGDAGSTNAILDATTNGFTLGINQTLGGIGRILASGQTVSASGTIAPGNSVGTIQIDGGTLTLNANTKFAFELGTSSDLISLLNLATLNLGNGVIGLDDFTFTNAGGFGLGTYTLISGAASLTGFLDSTNLTGQVLGFNSTLGLSGNNLVLNVIPEPHTALLGSLGVMALLRRRRTTGSKLGNP